MSVCNFKILKWLRFDQQKSVVLQLILFEILINRWIVIYSNLYVRLQGGKSFDTRVKWTIEDFLACALRHAASFRRNVQTHENRI